MEVIILGIVAIIATWLIYDLGLMRLSRNTIAGATNVAERNLHTWDSRSKIAKAETNKELKTKAEALGTIIKDSDLDDLLAGIN